MGTSASSKGPGAGVSFDPPWLDDIDVPGQKKQNDVNSDIGIAPKALVLQVLCLLFLHN